jgi:hypothetical protein
MGGQGSPGICHVCGRPVAPGEAFVSIGPTDWNDPSKPKFKRWVPAEEEIHGWTPFVVAHAGCFARDEGSDALNALIDEARHSR